MCARCPLTGGQRPQIRIIQLPAHPQPQQVGGADVSRDLRAQEAASRRAAEENHRRTQLQTALNSIQLPLVCVCVCTSTYIHTILHRV